MLFLSICLKLTAVAEQIRLGEGLKLTVHFKRNSVGAGTDTFTPLVILFSTGKDGFHYDHILSSFPLDSASSSGTLSRLQ